MALGFNMSQHAALDLFAGRSIRQWSGHPSAKKARAAVLEIEHLVAMAVAVLQSKIPAVWSVKLRYQRIRATNY
jgi:hypothetical protein